MTVKKDILSDPIIGENGVYILAVSNITAPSETEQKAGSDVARNYIERSFDSRTNYYAYEALKELAKIKDNRREFY
jgi:hypothetical protein